MRRFKSLSWLLFLAAFAFISACKNLENLPEDVDLPEILQIYPADGATNMPVDVEISVTFKSEVGDVSIVPSASGSGCVGTIQVSANDFDGCVEMGVITSDDNQTFRAKPLFNLDFDRKYKIKIVMLAKNAEGDEILHTHYTTPVGFATSSGGGPPVPGNSGNITLGDLSADYASLNWTAGHDSSDSTSDLEYTVVKSDRDNISIVSQAEANGETIINWTKNITASGRINLSSAVEYYFNVLLKDTEGNKAAYKRILLQTPDNVPPVPGNSGDISSDNIGLDSLTLRWTPATDNSDDGSVLSYKVVKSASDNISSVDEAEANGDILADWTSHISSLQVFDLTSSTVYHFNVLVKDRSGNKNAYNAGSVTTLDNVPPVAGNGDSSLDAYDVAAFSLTLSWNAAFDEIDNSSDLQYKVVRADDFSRIDTIEEANDNGPDIVTICDWEAGTTSCAVSGLLSVSTYYFNVLAKDTSGNMSIYAFFSVTTTDGLSPVPGNGGLITVSDLSDDSLKLIWTAAHDNSDDTSDLLYQAVKSESLGAVDSTSAALGLALPGLWSAEISADIGDLTIDTVYYFNVLVKDGSDNTTIYAPASAVPVDTIAPVPGSLTISYSDLSSDSVTLTWSKASDNWDGASKLLYKLARAGSADAVDEASEISNAVGDAMVMDLTADVTSATAVGLTPDTTYYFNALVQDEEGNAAVYQALSIETHDLIPPSVGSLSVSNLTGTSLTLSWPEAADTMDQASTLLYKVVRSAVNIDSTADAENNGTVIHDWDVGYAFENITDLTPDTLYYFNVLVKNSRQLVSGYGGSSATTSNAVWLDGAFGDDGMVIHHNAAGGNGDDLVQAGTSYSGGGMFFTGKSLKANGSHSMVVWRYNADGEPESGFDFDGLAMDDSADGLALAVDNQGRILIAGSVRNNDHADLAVWRYLPDGSLDETFDGDENGNGRITWNNSVDNSNDAAQAIVVDSEGGIWAAGYSQEAGGIRNLTLWRFLDNGRLDSNFDSDGSAVYDQGTGDNLARALTIDSKGRPLLAGHTENLTDKDLLLLRYTVDGNLDASFSGDGVVTWDNGGLSGDDNEGYSLKIDARGRIVVVGRDWNGSDYDMALWRYLPNGAPDSSFDSDGYASHHNAAGGNSHEAGYNLAFDNQELILVAGSGRNGDNNLDMVVWRYNLNGAPDAVFNIPNGYFTNDFGAGKDDEALSVFVNDSDGIMVSGYVVNASGDKDLAIWRLTAPENPNDSQAPIPGNDGILSASDLSSFSMTLNWTAGVDNSTEAANLEYKVVRSDSDNISTAAEVELYAPEVVMDWTTIVDASAAVDGLTPGATYYFNVLVRDAFGNETAYNMEPVAALDLSSSEITSIKIYTKFIELTFSEEMDLSVFSTGTNCSGITVQISSDGFGSCVQASDIVTDDNKTFILTVSLTQGTDYQVRLTSDLKDGDGANFAEHTSDALIAMPRGVNWSMKTSGAWSARYDVNAVVFNNEIWLLGGLRESDSAKLNEVYRSEDGENWTSAGNADWPARQSHAAAVFNDRIWVFGGDTNAGLNNDIWYYDQTSDTWQEVTAIGDVWSARRGHSAVVFDNKIWITGGYDGSSVKSDVWYSEDGENWTPAGNADWPARRIHSSVSFDNKLWIIGGSVSGTLDDPTGDVWHSEDGTNWTMATDSPLWLQRQGQCSISFDGALWLTGGHNGTSYKTDVWRSRDGVNWIQTSGNAWPSRSRTRHSCVEFQNKLWILGGERSGGARDDVWYLDESWTRVSASTEQSDGSPAWDARHGHFTVTYDDKIWLMGGCDGNNFSTQNLKNDVWYSEDGENWTPAGAADWSAREFAGAFVFQDKIWITGGGGWSSGRNSDVWSYDQTADSWTKTAEGVWDARIAHGSVVFNGKMWIMGGSAGAGNLNDVWNSADGVNWNKVSNSVWNSPRYGMTAVVYDNKMWVLGGYDGTFLNEVWHSEDGENWTQETGVSLSDFHWWNATVFDDKMWVLGGYGSSHIIHNKVSYSENGKDWITYNESPSWGVRCAYGTGVAFNDKLWIMGGHNNAGVNYGDVWHMESLKSENVPPTPGASGALSVDNVSHDSVTLSWTKAMDDSDVASDLRYKIIRSIDNNISALEEALANGKTAMNWSADVETGLAAGLTGGVVYYFNVIAKDSQGNMAVYAAQPVRSADDPAMEAYYPFSGDAVDESGNGNDGTIVDAVPAEDLHGGPAEAYQMNGTSAYIKIPRNVKPETQISFGIWAYKGPDTGNNWDNPGASYTLFSNTHGGGFAIYSIGSEPIALAYIGTGYKSATLPSDWHGGDNEGWRHFMATYDSSQLKFYVNGILKATTGATGTLSYGTDTNNLLVGAEPGAGDAVDGVYFNGNTDDFRIYNRALSASEVKDLYEAKVKNLKTETTPPTSGGGGTISFTDIGSVSASLSWTTATDNSDESSELSYKILRSESDNISTPEEALTNGTSDMSWTKDVGSGVISGLSPGIEYYFNVIVKDSQGNMAAYVAESTSTLGMSSAEIDSVKFYTKFIEITFSEEMDPATIIASLDCLSGSLNVYTAGGVCVGVSGVSSADDKTFILIPSGDLTAGDSYKITLTSDAEDSSGAALTTSEHTHGDLPASTYGDNWQEATSDVRQSDGNPAWNPRNTYSSVVFKNKIWVMGGRDSVAPRNDVWYSEDGATWSKAKDNDLNGWSARYRHSSVVFDGKIWVIGGFDGANAKNDVWHSSDGTSWTESAAGVPWPPRLSHSSVVFNDRIWVIGGWMAIGGAPINDVWYYDKSDGAWHNAAAAPWGPRGGHGSVVFDDKMWVIAGSINGVTFYKDIWHSTDGQSWTPANDPPWSSRYVHENAVFDDKIWLLGGWDGARNNEVWYSTDGEAWTQAQANDPSWDARWGQKSAVFQNKLWIMGGNDAPYYNDVWYLDETWTQATSAAKTSDGSPAWPELGHHSVESFDGKLWIMGGHDGFNYKNEVWYSEDEGKTWTEQVTATRWSPRYQHAAAVFDGKLWIMGGEGQSAVLLEDVWRYDPAQGDWAIAASDTPWNGRRGLRAAAFQGKLWVIAGYNGIHLSDVWYSEDGATWTQATSNAWGGAARYAQGALVFDNKLWVLGGSGGAGYLSDVWYSEDGATWTQANDMPLTREWFGASVFDDKIWIMGGYNGGYMKDVRYSKDGATWVQYSVNPPWAASVTGRGFFESAVLNNRLWMAGGYNNLGERKNDVWYLESMKTETVPPTPGDSGVLNVESVDSFSVNLSWTKAADNSDDVSELRYKIVASKSDNISTIEEALTNGTSDMSWTTDANGGTISGLSSSTLYYLNVIVKDTQGNMAVYNRKTATTSPSSTIVHNTDRAGGDYLSYDSPSVEACRDDCLADPNCLGWVYSYASPYASPVCYLKNPLPPQSPNACCASGKKE